MKNKTLLIALSILFSAINIFPGHSSKSHSFHKKMHAIAAKHFMKKTAKVNAKQASINRHGKIYHGIAYLSKNKNAKHALFVHKKYSTSKNRMRNCYHKVLAAKLLRK